MKYIQYCKIIQHVIKCNSAGNVLNAAETLMKYIHYCKIIQHVIKRNSAGNVLNAAEI